MSVSNPHIQQPLDSTSLGLNNIEFKNPCIQQTWIQQHLERQMGRGGALSRPISGFGLTRGQGGSKTPIFG